MEPLDSVVLYFAYSKALVSMSCNLVTFLTTAVSFWWYRGFWVHLFNMKCLKLFARQSVFISVWTLNIY